jgi:branched-chain amino acid transport system ATP-binding protein
MLETDALTKTFGGIIATDNLEIEVSEGEIHGLIGPNGSGKTTTFNLLTGFLSPDSGEIRFEGEDITGQQPYEISKKGIGRTFQTARPFAQMSVYENLLVPAADTSDLSREERASQILEDLDLDHVAENNAADLSGGQKKLLEIARVLMLDPTLILLDEPGAGVNPALMDDILDRIRALNDEGRTFLIIEHDMSVIDEITDRVTVMNAGTAITTGTFDEISQDERVKDAYLGG